MNESLLVATTNPGKIQEIKIYLKDLPLQIVSIKDLEFKGNYIEKGKTFSENARGKSLYYSQGWMGLTLAEDSGLSIVYLNGDPGVMSARFSGPRATDETNIAKVLRLMKKVPMDQRQAFFVSCMVLSRHGKIIKEIVQTVEGYLTNEKKGSYGFGYDPIFFYPNLNKTFAQLLPDQKNRVSHRGKALKKLKFFLQDYLQASLENS